MQFNLEEKKAIKLDRVNIYRMSIATQYAPYAPYSGVYIISFQINAVMVEESFKKD